MKKRYSFALSLLFVLFLFLSCTSKAEKLQNKKELKNRKSALSTQIYIEKAEQENQKILVEYIKSMPLEKKIAQLFIENLEGNTNFRSYETFGGMTGNGDETPLIAGGYLFFSYNLCENQKNQIAFMNSISDYSIKNNQIPPYLAIDQEGGFVNRLRTLTGGLPSQEKVCESNSIEQAYNLYNQQGYKMKDLGFHMNIAPVVEICTEDNKDFLNGRSFGNKENTISYSIACVNGYENSRIATVIKHFPGNTNTDPHTGLPEIILDYNSLMDSIESFKVVLQYYPTAILMSHARTTALDSNTPACLSKVWVTDILRNQFNYEGLIFSDDIFMGALAQNGYSPEKAAIMAIEAGIDCIMTSEKRFGKQAKVIYQKAIDDKAFEEKINKSVERILKYKIQAGIISYNQLMENFIETEK